MDEPIPSVTATVTPAYPFGLRFPASELNCWAQRYTYPGEEHIVETVGPRAGSRGYLDRDGFLALCKWKSPRSAKHCAANTEDLIREVTGIALSTKHEILRIRVLTVLRGVNWPTASAILHLCHSEPYPILDFRALWTLGIKKPAAYSFKLWWSYVEFCRALAEEHHVTMRALDRALWQYSKERQPRHNGTCSGASGPSD